MLKSSLKEVLILSNNIEIFKEVKPSLESYWRSIILYGNNTASYKFALGKSLLELATTEINIITLEELSPIFSRYICEHLKTAPKQTTNNSSTFLDACKKYNDGIIDKQQLLIITEKNAFNYVLDKFPIVNSSVISESFYEYDKRNKRLILDDNLFKLKDIKYFENLKYETEARWKLVETAWELGISSNILNVNYNDDNKTLFVNTSFRRKNITSVRDALNGYQKGYCFYCFDDITIDNNKENLCDVDHFFPHILQSKLPEINFNGVWNLVLTCQDCNRGQNGKFAKLPTIKYLERLHKRNEYLINSHHPLRETLMTQTGRTEKERISFLQDIYNFAKVNLITEWSAVPKQEDKF